MTESVFARSRTLTAVANTWPLLFGMFMLMLGAGLQGTLLSVRATNEGFATFVTGLVMSCYYVGYMGGSIGAPRLVQRVGHIRVFAALTAVASAVILLQGVFVEPTTWALLRGVSGFCFAGIYVVAESWLNDRASNQNRGSLLSVYMLLLYLGLGGGQFLLNVADTMSMQLFVVISVLISLAVVPMTLSVQRAPPHELPGMTGYRELFRASPLGVVGVAISGVVTSAMFAMGPVYAKLAGLPRSDVATFMGLSILTAVLTQLPIGRWSDRVDRRTVLIAICTLGAVDAGLATLFGTESRAWLYGLAAGFGGIALALYSLALSHINDHLDPEQMVGASGTVVLINGAGATLGPSLVAMSMDAFSAPAYFAFLTVSVGGLALYGIYRKSRRAPVAVEQKAPFVAAQPQAAGGQMIAEIALKSAEHREP